MRSIDTRTIDDGLGWPVPGVPRVSPRVRLPWNPPGSAQVTFLLQNHPRLMTALFALEGPAEFGQLMFASLPHREIELVVLRACWNSGGWSHWAWHAVWSQVRRKDDAYRMRLKLGPDAPGWSARGATLLRAVDELHDDLAISETTGTRLRQYFDERRILEICFITGHYELLAMTLESAGVPYDGWYREPGGLTPRRLRRPTASGAPAAGAPGLTADGAWWPADPRATDVLGLHPFMRWSLQRFSRASTRFATLEPADRDLAVYRIQGAHSGPDDPSLTRRQATLLRAVDELDTEYFITDTTWQEVSTYLNSKQLIELCVLVGHVRTFRMLLNSVRAGPADEGRRT